MLPNARPSRMFARASGKIGIVAADSPRVRERERDGEREIVARPRGLIIHESSVAFDKLFLAVRC